MTYQAGPHRSRLHPQMKGFDALSTRLSSKQNETRLQGLRILARMIVRAHLARLMEAEAGRNGSCPALPAADARGTVEKKGGHAG